MPILVRSSGNQRSPVWVSELIFVPPTIVNREPLYSRHPVIIDNIKEIRSGAETRYYREHFRISEDKEPLWLTIIYTAQAKYKTLHLIAFEAGVFRLWDTTLRRLFSFRQNLLSGLGGVEQRDDAWEKQYWKDTDMSGDHRADFAEIERLCRRLNISTSSADLLNVFMVGIFVAFLEHAEMIAVGIRFSWSWLSRICRFSALRRPSQSTARY